jgi:hypothetical protein
MSNEAHLLAEEKTMLEPIRNLQYLLRNSEFYKNELPYDVELEVVAWSKIHAEIFLRRYAKGKAKHWSENQKRTVYVGMIGQKIFHVICQQIGVPTDVNDATIDWRTKKPYDFFIPMLGTIEVKCYDHYTSKVLIKVSEWHDNDFLVVFKFRDKQPSRVDMMGWLTKNQVEALPIAKKGETKFSKYADCYHIEFDKLNKAKKFLKMMYEAKQKINSLNEAIT